MTRHHGGGVGRHGGGSPRRHWWSRSLGRPPVMGRQPPLRLRERRRLAGWTSLWCFLPPPGKLRSPHGALDLDGTPSAQPLGSGPARPLRRRRPGPWPPAAGSNWRRIRRPPLSFGRRRRRSVWSLAKPRSLEPHVLGATSWSELHDRDSSREPQRRAPRVRDPRVLVGLSLDRVNRAGGSAGPAVAHLPGGCRCRLTLRPPCTAASASTGPVSAETGHHHKVMPHGSPCTDTSTQPPDPALESADLTRLWPLRPPTTMDSWSRASSERRKGEGVEGRGSYGGCLFERHRGPPPPLAGE